MNAHTTRESRLVALQVLPDRRRAERKSRRATIDRSLSDEFSVAAYSDERPQWLDIRVLQPQATPPHGPVPPNQPCFLSEVWVERTVADVTPDGTPIQRTIMVKKLVPVGR
eukprot:TRINITY_DN60320_c0_g1_i1.p1 TRINITY_DN60320_c0_g1~~TRINITY_DN60320_c0_g1_i1.p1  ORF type:complete len:111 (+),score=14.76 TRINITY_DN60320_c0_g1_i1:30-362(+)